MDLHCYIREFPASSNTKRTVHLRWVSNLHYLAGYPAEDKLIAIAPLGEETIPRHICLLLPQIIILIIINFW